MEQSILFLLLYFLPSFIAIRRRHHNQTAIMLVNFFFGITIIGWFVALIWSVTNPAPKEQTR
jgi:hypothetical protein